ncbi:Histone-lysine N-methyltransferase (Ash1) [Penicillium taxi]|uniref:Histone-lysine N-methyltransferase (Ash1) n=1 Tax=Penicillium taxi TaxID=168475 RepID=UPI002545BA80|nr:Histone-lysine N-methyltransferase (Ash1) [Penicillium taxi]KAJ5885004.1 Histone-lysine N-methyltransferase (Ash1) [Penicillium taxi]
MARRTTRLSAAASPVLADVPVHVNPDDTMSLDVPEQLLTPEMSRSETSSNYENVSTEDKPAARRRSTRVKRASLRSAEFLEDTPVNDDQTTASSSQAYVDDLVKSKRSRSKLRHSIAVMESTLLNGSDAGDLSMAPATPISKSSQEPDLNTLPDQQDEDSSIMKGKKPQPKATSKSRSKPSVRRSTRLSIVGTASNILDRASSSLGKRSREGKEIGRRASLRPRNVAPKEEPAISSLEPTSKKRRLSESDLSKLQSEEPSSSKEQASPLKLKPKKIWLAHGLYSGQEPTDKRPKQRNSKNSAKTNTGPSNRRLLPMPIFAGSRLIAIGKNYELPFDIFSPLPPGQPKPNEWRKTNKNVFVGDAASEWRSNKKLELSTCMCEEETGCDENCQNRYMFYECDNSNCRLGIECGNRNFNELKARTKAGGKYNIGVEVIKTSDRGYGVRSNRSFDANQIIVEYTGEILTQFECEKRMRTAYKNNECYYLMYFDQNMIIDATRGSIARFINHSCEPNCRMEKWTVAGKPRMALFAGDRGIMTGEELSYDYNFNPYSNKSVQECRCGAENCRGFLGPRPKEKEQRVKAEAIKVDAVNNAKKASGVKRKRAGETTASTPDKKRKLLTTKSIKAGVEKAVVKATTARGKALSRKVAATSKVKVVTKKTVKLPAVKAAGRVKAAVQRKTSMVKATKAVPVSPSKKTSRLKRPSAETRRKILAAAKGSTRKASTPKSAAKNSPAKAGKSQVKNNTASKSLSKAKDLGKSLKNAAGKVARTVRVTQK